VSPSGSFQPDRLSLNLTVRAPTRGPRHPARMRILILLSPLLLTGCLFGCPAPESRDEAADVAPATSAVQ
jgi:hypothetical protein